MRPLGSGCGIGNCCGRICVSEHCLEFYRLFTYNMDVKKINLTEKELARRDVINAFNLGHITRVSAAEQLAITVRQLHILRQRYKHHGDQGLIDRRRFTKGNFSKPRHLKAQVMGLIRVNYAGLGPTAVCRKLASECGLALHLETVRLWMTKAGICTARRGHYQISEADRATRAAKSDLTANDREIGNRNRCLPPRLLRSRRIASSVKLVTNGQTISNATVDTVIPIDGSSDDCRSSQGALNEPDQGRRISSMADLDALFAAHGTSAVELDELAASYAIQLMEKLRRPVTEEEIEDFVDKCDPNLLPVLRLIDAARATDEERGKRCGKRLTIEQRQTILAMLRQNVSGADIARTFKISTGAIATYQRQLRAMDEEDRASNLRSI